MTDDIVTRLRSATTQRKWWPRDRLEAAADIERMRGALRRISHAPHGKMYCADGHEEAVLIARAAIEEEASHD